MQGSQGLLELDRNHAFKLIDSVFHSPCTYAEGRPNEFSCLGSSSQPNLSLTSVGASTHRYSIFLKPSFTYASTSYLQVMEIPDLDGGFDDEEEFQRQVAAPPKARQNRVQSINELDKTVQYALPHSKDEIDLSLLISALCPMEKVKEEDEVWEPESLLSNVAFEIQSEKEQMEDKEEEAAGGAADTTKFAEEQSLFTM